MRYGDRDRGRSRDHDRDRNRNDGRNRTDNRNRTDSRNRNDTRNRNDNRGRNDTRNRNDGRSREAQDQGDRRFSRSRRRRRRDFQRRPREQRRDWPVCPVCQRPIQEMTSAITHSETGQPAHFDCVMKAIEAQEGLGPNERVCYLGKGSFGILRFQKNGGTIPFIIRKRIQYETAEETPEWRKEMDKFSSLQNREKQKLQAGTPPPPAPSGETDMPPGV